MKPDRQYEELVRKLVTELTACALAFHGCSVEGGPQHHVRGASGFPHQIDATVRIPGKLLLIECKYWSSRVDAEPVLVLASRVADITAAESGTRVFGSVVSTKDITAGAQTLATYFGISIDAVENLREYAIRVFNHVFVGIHDSVKVTDEFSATVIRGNKANKAPEPTPGSVTPRAPSR